MQREIKILLATSALINLAGGMLGPIYAIFVQNIGGGILTAGTTYSLFAIVAGIMTFFISKLEDKYDHQEFLIVIGYSIMCLGYFSYLLIKTPMHLFMVQVLFGMGAAIISPAYASTFSSHLDKGKYASEWGMWDAQALIVTGISAFIGSFIAKELGFTYLFVTMGTLSLCSALFSLMLLKSKKNMSLLKLRRPSKSLRSKS